MFEAFEGFIFKSDVLFIGSDGVKFKRHLDSSNLSVKLVVLVLMLLLWFLIF